MLHVTESWSAGVATAITGWVQATPDIEHVLLRAGRPDAPVRGLPITARELELPRNPLRASVTVWRTVRHERPDVVHAHSSWAGAVVRLLPVRHVVYTPHAFAWQRTDLRPAARRAVYAAEWLLARRPHVLAACSVDEAALATTVGARRVVGTPHVLPSAPAGDAPQGHDPLLIAFAGRVAPQKGVDFASAVADRLLAVHPQVCLRWIGGGDAASEAALRSAGVEVTGWLSADQARRQLTAAAVYVHTAAWEGLPLTVQEALAAGVPVVARTLPALDELPVMQAATPQEVADAAAALLDPTARALASTRCADAWAARSGTDTGDALRSAYRHAVGR